MVIGGFYDGSPTNMVQTIDFSTNEIKKIASLNKNRYSHACAVAIWGEEEYIVAAGSIFFYSTAVAMNYYVCLLFPCYWAQIIMKENLRYSLSSQHYRFYIRN